MRPHGQQELFLLLITCVWKDNLVFVAHHLCIKKNNLVFVAHHLSMKENNLVFVAHHLSIKENNLVLFDQMVSRCQRRCIRVLCSGSCDFLLFHMCSARSPQFFSNGLAHFHHRLCKSQNIFPAWLTSKMVLAQHFCTVCLLASCGS